MVDHEVENTLREIRERVRAAAPPPAALTTTVSAPNAAAPLAHAPDAAHAGAARDGSPEALARMEANLATTGRAWSRLPPLVSNRRGAVARLELRVKRLVKRALHWFTWEQVNFNSAAHHALRDALAALSAHEQLLARARAEAEALRRRADEADAESARLEAAGERRHAELRAGLRAELRGEMLGELRHKLRAELHAELHAGLHTQLRAELRPELHAELRDELSSKLHGELSDALRAELRTGLGGELRDELGGELRERVAHLTDEQRVCFRQLSLEATEAAVAHDRARRLVEERIEELEKAVNRES